MLEIIAAWIIIIILVTMFIGLLVYPVALIIISTLVSFNKHREIDHDV